MLIAYVLLLLAVSMDLRSMKISNRLIFFGLVFSLIRRFLNDGIAGLFAGIILISIPVIFLYLLFLAGALGAGDIKLLSLVGGFVNFKELMWCMIITFIFASVFSLGKMIYYGTFLLSMKHAGRYLCDILHGKWEKYQPISTESGYIHFSVAILFACIVVDIFLIS